MPRNRYRQSDVLDFMLEAVPAEERLRRYVRRIYGRSGIEFRHSVLDDLAPSPVRPFFRRNGGGEWRAPTTGQRNAIFVRESRPIFSGVARSALSGSGFTAEEVTHVVTVSCTGFYNPGPDYFIVKELGLRPDTDRIHVGFMGCYGMFPALKIAEAVCRSDTSAVVLVACVELCTLHIQLKASADALLAGSLFADGGGAMIVSAQRPRSGGPSLEIGLLASRLLPDSEGDMAWSVGDDGFDIVLSAYVPRVIEGHIRPAIDDLLACAGLDAGHIHRWAIHPGGRAILDRVASALRLAPPALAVSRAVLRDYGNLSAATLFFVLDAMLHEPPVADGERICAVAFGPGLTAETGLFLRH